MCIQILISVFTKIITATLCFKQELNPNEMINQIGRHVLRKKNHLLKKQGKHCLTISVEGANCNYQAA